MRCIIFCAHACTNDDACITVRGMSPAALPDDIETLKRLVIGRDEMIAKLMAEIARLKRWRFGRSAERMDAALAQLQLRSLC